MDEIYFYLIGLCPNFDIRGSLNCSTKISNYKMPFVNLEKPINHISNYMT